MTISGTIYTALRGLVNDRCYPLKFPQEDIPAPGTVAPPNNLNKPTWPAIRYSIVTVETDPTLCGTDTVDTDNTTVQIDVVALTYGGMTSLRDQIIIALQTVDPPCTREGYLELPDAETRTYRGILTYQFHASTPGGVSP